MSDRDGTWAPVVKSIAHSGPGYGEGEYRWWGGWGRKIEPKRWQQQCTSPCSLRCRRYSFSPPSDGWHGTVNACSPCRLGSGNTKEHLPGAWYQHQGGSIKAPQLHCKVQATAKEGKKDVAVGNWKQAVARPSGGEQTPRLTTVCDKSGSFGHLVPVLRCRAFLRQLTMDLTLTPSRWKVPSPQEGSTEVRTLFAYLMEAVFVHCQWRPPEFRHWPVESLKSLGSLPATKAGISAMSPNSPSSSPCHPMSTTEPETGGLPGSQSTSNGDHRKVCA
ncbi:hypothetical protein BDP67DRAFT_490636 [Colletotrichum lupini]|nr:hypothetical protein BDP67DRAFT_490636 [Colletotrichum lupini]